jgi:hypothetical protein
MKGGLHEPIFSYKYKCSTVVRPGNSHIEKWEKILTQQDKKLKDFCDNTDTKNIFVFSDSFDYLVDDMISGKTGISFKDYEDAKKKYKYDEIIKELINLIKDIKKIFDESYIPYEEFDLVIPNPNNSSNNSNSSNSSNSSNISEYSYKKFLTYLHQELEKK